MIRLLTVAIASIAFSSLAVAQDVTGLPGQFDFGRIPGVSSQPSVEINLNSLMLGFVRAAARSSDPEAGDVLAGIENVRVLVYEIGEDEAALLDFVDVASTVLEGDAWQRIVYVQEEGESVRIYVKFNDTNLAGLTLLVADSGGEAVFANLAGDIDPAKLGNIARTLGMEDVIGELTEISGEAISNAETTQD